MCRQEREVENSVRTREKEISGAANGQILSRPPIVSGSTLLEWRRAAHRRLGQYRTKQNSVDCVRVGRRSLTLSKQGNANDEMPARPPVASRDYPSFLDALAFSPSHSSIGGSIVNENFPLGRTVNSMIFDVNPNRNDERVFLAKHSRRRRETRPDRKRS